MVEVSMRNFISAQGESFDQGGLFALELLETRWVWYRSRRWNIERLRTSILSSQQDKHLGIDHG